VHNRIHKVLEDASIKLDTVASDILGTTSGLVGRQSPGNTADQEEPTPTGIAWKGDRAPSLDATANNRRAEVSR
jgi:hypothetical protein